MSKIIGIICAITAITTASVGAPRDLVDQAKEQLEQLQAIVQGEIMVAHNKLAALITDFKTNEVTVSEKGIIDLQQEEQTVVAELQSIKELAHSAGKDVSSCTDIPEAVLIRLPEHYSSQIVNCIADVDENAVQAERDARYLVDVYINKVHDLRHQMDRCHDELLCISPILTEIELNKIRLPQNIGTEVEATQSLLEVMKLSVTSCANDKVAQYSTEAFSILGEITTCVNDIIG